MSIITERINPYGGNLSHTIIFFDSDGGFLDITRQVVEFNIYESIFNNTLSADLVIRDAIGIIDAGQSPMTGQEYIEITFESNNPSLIPTPTITFKVHRVANKTELTAGASVFTLHCSSRELEKNMNTSVNTSYKDKIGSEAVDDIFNNFIKLDNNKALAVEESENIVPYTATGHTPFEAINVIARESRSKGKYGDASHYLFYETTQGFNFRTLSNLLQQEPLSGAEYYFSDAAVSDSYPIERTIIGHTYLDNVNTIDSLLKGMYGSETAVIDPITKTFSESSFDYAAEFDRLPHVVGGGYPTINLGANKPLGSESTGLSHKRLLIGDLARLNGNNITFDSRITANNDPYTFHGRERYRKAPLVASQLASLRQYGINISVPVNLNINAGDVIQLFIPGNKDREGVDDSAFINHYGSNPTFLVVSTAVKLTADGDYISTFQCVKESFATDLRGQKIAGLNDLNKLTSNPVKYIMQNYIDKPFGTDNIISSFVSKLLGGTGD